MKFAIHGLQGLQLDPSRMIQLALQYSLIDFVKPAVTKLFKPTPIDPTTFNPEQVAENAQAKKGFAPLRNLTPLNRAQLRFEAYAILAQAQEAIDHEARLIAACAPPFVVVDSLTILGSAQTIRSVKKSGRKYGGTSSAVPFFTPFAPHIFPTSSVSYAIPSFLEWLIVDAVAHLDEQDAFGAEREYIQMATELIIKLFNPNLISFSISESTATVNI